MKPASRTASADHFPHAESDSVSKYLHRCHRIHACTLLPYSTTFLPDPSLSNKPGSHKSQLLRSALQPLFAIASDIHFFQRHNRCVLHLSSIYKGCKTSIVLTSTINSSQHIYIDKRTITQSIEPPPPATMPAATENSEKKEKPLHEFVLHDPQPLTPSSN